MSMTLTAGDSISEEQAELLEELTAMADAADHPLDFDVDRFKEIMNEINEVEEE